MAEIVWLTSYPKSGNTWTRAFISKYRAAEEDDLDINGLSDGLLSSSRLIFDRAIGVEASALHADEIDNLRAAAFRLMASQHKKTLFMKTHEVWRCSAAGEPLFPADVTRGVVYIVRNPLDIAISGAHHFALSPEKAVANLNDENYSIALHADGIREQLWQPLRSWSGHVRSWLDDSALPIHLMRYEDMLADPVDAFGKLVHFVGLEYDTAKLQAAVQATSFEALRRQESDKGFRERPGQATAPFFREGRAGAWRDHLSPHLVNAIVEAHAATMQRLGYLDAQGNLFG